MAAPIQVKIDYTRYMQFDRKAVRTAARKGGALLRKEARKLASANRPSAPGEPPGRVTSMLFRSIYGRSSKRGYAMVAGTTAPHAHLLEIGTPNMAARPLMPMALANQRDAVTGLFIDAIGAGCTVIDGSPGVPPKEVEVG
jgi:HK97 gp10 family phage protein